MSQEIATINEKIASLEPQMLKTLNEQTVRRELSFAKQLVGSSKQLQECTMPSVLTAIYNICNIGLSLNPASKEAYIVPRYNSQSKCKEASLQPSYVGLVKLLTDAGTVTQVVTNIVHEGDVFEMDIANGTVKHLPCLVRANKGAKIGCYAMATLPNGAKQVEWMEQEDIYSIRDCSESWKNENTRAYSPWMKHEDEMSRKTVIRRLYKYLPRSGSAAKIARVDEVIQIDDAQYNATFGQLGYIESLMQGANITPEVERRINSEYQNYSNAEAETCINFLLSNQSELNDPKKQFEARLKN
jgi:recombination protein RecT